MASEYSLRIVTPDRLFFEGEVENTIVPTIDGDVGILKGHINYVTALSIGALRVLKEGKWRTAAISGGFIKVQKSGTTIVADACEWEDEIDVERAKRAHTSAKNILASKTSERESELAELKLKRALNRINIAKF